MNFINSVVIFLYLMGTATYLFFLFIQKKGWEKTGQYFLTAGFVIHTAILVYGLISSGHIPARNLHETLSVAGWAVVCTFLILQYKFNLKILGVYAAPLALLIMVISFILPKTPVHDPEIFKSFWLFLHILFIFLGEASFALACGVGVLYLLQERCN
jgi:ABC-type transport system involved in cytochrome c biogenesis permease subunit